MITEFENIFKLNRTDTYGYDVYLTHLIVASPLHLRKSAVRVYRSGERPVGSLRPDFRGNSVSVEGRLNASGGNFSREETGAQVSGTEMCVETVGIRLFRRARTIPYSNAAPPFVGELDYYILKSFNRTRFGLGTTTMRTVRVSGGLSNRPRAGHEVADACCVTKRYKC